MTIHISLSTESIDDAIMKLSDYQQEIEGNLKQVVEKLTYSAADVANVAYGDWGVEARASTDESHGYIDVVGDMPAIAEFGAGDATNPVGFENIPGDVYAGSYSEQHAKQYSRWGFWYFAGEPYTEVPGRHGLRQAKDYIIENSTQVAMEVFGS